MAEFCDKQTASVKPIKLSMIRLGSEVIPEEVVIRPGLRYAIVKVTNDMMTAHKGMWSWTAQEVDWTKGPPDLPSALGASRSLSPRE